MLANFFRVSFRYLSKNKVYSLINILGLALGMACFILLTLFVKKELSYDEYHAEKELVYQVLIADSAKTVDGFRNRMQAPAGPHLKETVPEVTHAARFGRINDALIKADGKKYIIPRINYSDADLFTIFDIPLLNTTKERVTLEKNQIILSRSEAERLYGSVDEAIGAEFEFVDLDMFEVVAVFEDLPAETHLDFDLLVSFQDYAHDLMFFKSRFSFGTRKVTNWGVVSAFPTYVKLDKPLQSLADFQDMEAKVHNSILPHQGYKEFKLLPLNDVYFSELAGGYFKDSGDMSQIELYLTIAAIVLLVAIVNYTNMATARYARRAKEVGIRKTVGGHRSQIIKQFLVESVSISLFSLLLAVCLSELVLPYFNGYTGKEIHIAYGSLWTYAIFITGAVMIGVIAGMYPSFYLSRFNPLRSLNGLSAGRGGKLFRQLLVGFQFTTCLALMAVTGIVYSQFNHMQSLDKGFDSEQLVAIDLKGDDTRKSYDAFKAELLKSAYVSDVAGASFSVFDERTAFFIDVDGREEPLSITIMIAESNFLDLLGVNKASGRLLSELPESEQGSHVVLNKSAIEEIKWDEPLGKEFNARKVTAVVDDFIYGSAKDQIEPLMVITGSSGYDLFYIKMSGNIRAAMDQIEDIFYEFSSEYPFEYSFVDEQFAKKYESEEKLSQVLGTFSGLTIFIAGLGILGLSIFMAEQRTKEIGIRRVLGASLGQIVWLLNRSVTWLILIISLITLPTVYYFIGDWLDSFAYTISLNGLYFLLPLAMLLGIVWAILFYQSFRSANASPVNALRTE